MRVTRETAFSDDRRALHFEDFRTPVWQLGNAETLKLLKAIESAAVASQGLLAGHTSAVEQTDLRRAVLRGVRAKRRLVEASLGERWSYARLSSRPLRRPRCELEDLMQEAVVGLIEAVDALGSDFGELFPAYASRWMQDAVRTASGERPLPRRVGAPRPPRNRAHAYSRITPT